MNLDLAMIHARTIVSEIFRNYFFKVQQETSFSRPARYVEASSAQMSKFSCRLLRWRAKRRRLSFSLSTLVYYNKIGFPRYRVSVFSTHDPYLYVDACINCGRAWIFMSSREMINVSRTHDSKTMLREKISTSRKPKPRNVPWSQRCSMRCEISRFE